MTLTSFACAKASAFAKATADETADIAHAGNQGGACRRILTHRGICGLNVGRACGTEPAGAGAGAVGGRRRVGAGDVVGAGMWLNGVVQLHSRCLRRVGVLASEELEFE